MEQVDIHRKPHETYRTKVMVANRRVFRLRTFIRLLFISTIVVTFTILISFTVSCSFLQCRKFPRYILDTESSAAIVLNYHNDWCVLQNWRINWENMLKPCDGKISWQKRNVYSDLRTDASKSYIKKMDLKPAG